MLALHSWDFALHVKILILRLPIGLTQVKASNTPYNILNEICQVIYVLFQVK